MNPEKTCPQCGNAVVRKPGPGRPPIYCSPQCADDAHHARYDAGYNAWRRKS